MLGSAQRAKPKEERESTQRSDWGRSSAQTVVPSKRAEPPNASRAQVVWSNLPKPIEVQSYGRTSQRPMAEQTKIVLGFGPPSTDLGGLRPNRQRLWPNLSKVRSTLKPIGRASCRLDQAYARSQTKYLEPLNEAFYCLTVTMVKKKDNKR